MTKKETRAVLSPLSKAVLAGARNVETEISGLRVVCDRLNNRFCAGPAWTVHFTIMRGGKNVSGGSLADVVERIPLVLDA